MSRSSRNRGISARRIGIGNGRLLLLAALGLAMLSLSGGLVAFTVTRLHRAAVPQSTEDLARCLDDNAVANLTVDGEALIEQACREWVRNRAPEAACVLRRHETMTDDDATRAVEKACAAEPPRL